MLGATFGAGKGPSIDESENEFIQAFSEPKDEGVEIDDLPKDVFEKEKDGLIPEGGRFIPMSQLHGMGLFITPEHKRVNTLEERAFLDEIYVKHDRTSIPKFWDSRTKGK